MRSKYFVPHRIVYMSTITFHEHFVKEKLDKEVVLLYQCHHNLECDTT